MSKTRKQYDKEFNIMKFKIQLIFTIVNCILSTAYAQRHVIEASVVPIGRTFISDKEIFNAESKRSGFEYNLPEGFKELDLIELQLPGNRILLNTFDREIENKEKNIVVCFTVTNFSSINDSIVREISPSYVKNDQYKSEVKSKIDSTHNKLTYFNKDYTQKTFNADVAGIYDFIPIYPYHNKYTLCKIVFIHKQDRADLEMFYFYNKESEAKINKFITDNKVMIKFKDY